MEGLSSQKADEKKSDHIILKSDSKNHKVIIDEILYIESLDDYVKVHTINGKLVCYSRLVVMEELLKNHNNMVRIHRSYMINISHAKSFTNFNVEIDGKELPIGRKYKEQVISKLQA
ncbi:MAG: LytTR family DNA-binding domain-containing protein [Tenuifilaceae bacterium]|nr:LytTR family DNA-binding domain-containing protein [Tenuifilaceae bacterium]